MKCTEVDGGERDLLLATGGLDKFIYIWRTGSDGRYEVILNLPNSALSNPVLNKYANLFTYNGQYIITGCQAIN